MVRKKSRFPYVLIVIAAIIACFVFLFWPQQPPYGRTSVIQVGDPMILLSWNTRDNSVTRILLPSTIAAEGTHGYGTYSLEAFWRLGEIDKKDGSLLRETISEVFGIPVEGYINGPITMGNIVKFLMGGYRTNMTIASFTRWAWLFDVTKPSSIDDYNFTRNPFLLGQSQMRADGSSQLVLLPDRIDTKLAHIFEDERIRRETLTTAVLNTTDVPFLGNRAARMLATLGVAVVTVGNDDEEVEGCTVTGVKNALGSVSADVIRAVFGCQLVEVKQPERADLTVRIGTSYAKRFLPN